MTDWTPAFKPQRQARADAGGVNVDLEALWRAFLTSIVVDPERARQIHERSKKQRRLPLPRHRHRAVMSTRKLRPKPGDYSPRVLTYPRADVIGSEQLTAKEIEVLTLLATGLKTPAIARKLKRSPHTVHRQILTASRRLGCRSGGHAVAVAIRTGQVLPPAG